MSVVGSFAQAREREPADAYLAHDDPIRPIET
jgi:hypothetical protein